MHWEKKDCSPENIHSADESQEGLNSSRVCVCNVRADLDGMIFAQVMLATQIIMSKSDIHLQHLHNSCTLTA